MRRRLTYVAGLSLVAATTALAGCGGSSSGNGVASKSPTEILSAAKAAADGASSVHVSGSTVTAGTPLTLDLSLVANRGGRGRIAENGLSFELIELEGTIYIKGSTAFYKHFAGAAAAQLLQGKWLKAPATSASFAGLSSLVELHKLLDAALASSDKALVKTGASTLKGQAVVGVKDTAQGETIYVATTGRPYPVAATKSGAGGGTIAFAEWNKPVTLTAPANAVDIEQLQHSQ
ncbi:MAG TPA: hypothetical protein VG147_04535 [Solirubrobacteraceae bacterium]|nr:hypothetical protein [Solirubrobacteraceae bacterium]